MGSFVQQIQTFVNLFTSIVWEAMPFIVLGAILAGILEELLPQRLITKVLPKNPIISVIAGGLLGLIFPMCECGIVVVMRRLLKKGLPLSCCIAYMLAGPIVNVVVLVSTVIAFKGQKLLPSEPDGQGTLGPWMVILRAGLGFTIACLTGLVVYWRVGTGRELLADRAMPTGTELEMAETTAKKPLVQRIDKIASTALHDFRDIMMFLIIGALLAAMVKLFVAPTQIETFSQQYPYLAIPAMMVFAVLMCLCSEADAFVAASFQQASVSSKLAFLVLGPMLDLKLLIMYTRIFKPKLIGLIVTCTVSFTLMLTLAVHFGLTTYTASAIAQKTSTTTTTTTPSPTPEPGK
jgi:hypothetical protein